MRSSALRASAFFPWRLYAIASMYRTLGSGEEPDCAARSRIAEAASKRAVQLAASFGFAVGASAGRATGMAFGRGGGMSLRSSATGQLSGVRGEARRLLVYV